MKRIIATVLAASVLGAAGVAAAQATSIDDRIDRIESRIDQGVDDGTLSAAQAADVRKDLWTVRRTRDNLENSGAMNDARRLDLNARLDTITYTISRDRYFGRYGTFRGYRQNWDWSGDEGEGPN
jgi:hypothetical protein